LLYLHDPRAWENAPGNTTCSNCIPAGSDTCSGVCCNRFITDSCFPKATARRRLKVTCGICSDYECCEKVGTIFLWYGAMNAIHSFDQKTHLACNDCHDLRVTASLQNPRTRRAGKPSRASANRAGCTTKGGQAIRVSMHPIPSGLRNTWPDWCAEAQRYCGTSMPRQHHAKC